MFWRKSLGRWTFCRRSWSKMSKKERTSKRVKPVLWISGVVGVMEIKLFRIK